MQTPVSRHPQNEEHIFNNIKWSNSFLFYSLPHKFFFSFSSTSTLKLLKLQYLCHCRWKIPLSGRRWSSNLSLPSTTTKSYLIILLFCNSFISIIVPYTCIYISSRKSYHGWTTHFPPIPGFRVSTFHCNGGPNRLKTVMWWPQALRETSVQRESFYR